MKEIKRTYIRLTDEEKDIMRKMSNIADNFMKCKCEQVRDVGRSLLADYCSFLALEALTDYAQDEIVTDFTVHGEPYSEDIIVD